ncbi:hypothetical protein BGZ63DRAFT_180980 [Mariannaea sp. PMI_226]|nr:hypothetical protein BGZ63DRAFT_180980 [Mariannaea sp. PMI_226]
MASSNSHISPSMSPDHGALTSEGEDKVSSSSLGPNIFQALAEKRTTRGNPPKKRGPKPNAKPALTRRQELNRQAQRTHRERKELYIKALEDEVIRLKEIFSNVSLDRERLADENKQLRDALVQNGIPVGSPGSTTSYGPGSSSARSPLMTGLATTPAMSSSSHISPGDGQHMFGQPIPIPDMTQQIAGQGGVDVEQAGIDFVLTLEKPCQAHLQFLIERKADLEGDACGHALMATCPSELFPTLTAGALPYEHNNSQGGIAGGQDSSAPTKADLATLLHLSKKLDLDGEVTPIMAWGMVLSHPKVHVLGLEHFQMLAEVLIQKVRCYGFGAVMEEFEVRDALDSIFA